MPAVPSGLVLVTGASGFIGVHVVRELLEQGYKVRGSVRSNEKGDYLLKKFPSGFEYVIVKDLEASGGFDSAVKEVDAVLHTASPFHYKGTDAYKDLVNPAVNGTKNVLGSILKSGDKVKRVVITSSYASIVDSRKKRPHTFSEKDWNTEATDLLEKEGKDLNQNKAYSASKTLAEQAAWAFVKENNPTWDLVTMCPPLVLGPILHQCESPDKLNQSVGTWYEWLNGSKKGEEAPGPRSNVVDVRDLSHAHVKALSVEAAGKNRFAIANQPYTWQLCLDEVYGDEEVMKNWPKLPKGTRGADKVEEQNVLDASKSKEILQMTYLPLKQTLIDMSTSLAEYEAVGWST